MKTIPTVFVCICKCVFTHMCMELDKLILKFMWKSKGSRTTKTLLKKRKKVEALALLDTKTYYETILFETKDRQMDSWN